jgi:glycine/serine hydroxymethyltransferase
MADSTNTEDMEEIAEIIFRCLKDSSGSEKNALADRARALAAKYPLNY